MSAILTCNNLSKRYGATQAVHNLTLTVEPGRIIGLLGPNGSGKTTLIKLANGLLTPTGGEVLVDGKKPGVETHALVSYLPERTSIPLWMTIDQLLDFYQDFYGDFDRVAAVHMLENLGLQGKQRIKELSKGNREKVQLTMVMSRRALLYLLDEPIGGVDPATRDYIIHTILTNYNPEAAVLISTHLIADVEQVLDEVIFIKNGELYLQSSVDQIREAKGVSVDALFREVFKC
jgi:ABC-2 type transport system ATP-binding protein